MDATLLLSSAVVSAMVGGLVSFLSHRRLAERQAQIDYESLARRRLYEAIGPLRLQLLLAARDLSSRVGSHHAARSWNMDPSGYYVKSFIYRFLRPLSIGALIERQMSYADFTVDEQALGLLKFNAVANKVLTGSDAIFDHPHADWSGQTQHLYRDNLAAAASILIDDQPGSGGVVMDYARFSELVENPSEYAEIASLAKIFETCNSFLYENPIFWTRMVGYGYVCKNLLSVHGKGLGFAPTEYAPKSLLNNVEDQFILDHLKEFELRLEELIARGL